MNAPSKISFGGLCLVTGAGKGIGRAVATAFARAGAKLALTSRTQSDLESLRDELAPAEILIAAGDAADEEFIGSFVGAAKKKFGRIDCLVNNAGILTPRAPVVEVKTADWDETMRVNLRGPFLWMKRAAPVMIEQKSGSIINVSSGAGKRAAAEWGPYAVSKFGIEGLTLASAAELKSFGVRVNAVNPGGTRTRMRAAAYPNENPLKLATPDEVADLFLWLASAASGTLTGESIDYTGWKERHA